MLIRAIGGLISIRFFFIQAFILFLIAGLMGLLKKGEIEELKIIPNQVKDKKSKLIKNNVENKKAVSYKKLFLWIGLFIVILIITNSMLAAYLKNNSSHQTSNSVKKETQLLDNPQQNQEIKNSENTLKYKYTLDDCNTACDDAYNIQAQVDVCQSSCEIIGKEGATLDKYVNKVKNIKTSSEIQLCSPDWQCTSWSSCNSNGKQARTCTDSNNCGISNGKPSETQSCTSLETATWHQITSFSGNGIKNTETFTIPSREWRISWDTSPGEYGAMNFQIFVYNEDGSLEGVAANVIGADKDSSIMRGTGNYYLMINTAQPYTVIIEANY